MSKELENLKAMLEDKTFDHATYRNIGTIWEGLWIYKKSVKGFRGFDVAGCFLKDNPDLKEAEELVRGTGISVGSFGKG